MNAPLLPGLEPQIAPPTSSPFLDADRILAAMQKKAGEAFSVNAAKHVLLYLDTHGEAPAEQITDAVKARGVVPPPHMDDRAFGSVYRSLAFKGLIVKGRSVPRLKGHGTSGGNVWAKVITR